MDRFSRTDGSSNGCSGIGSEAESEMDALAASQAVGCEAQRRRDPRDVPPPARLPFSVSGETGPHNYEDLRRASF
jgi:hypothetical protein